MLIFNLEIRKFCTRFSKLTVVPVYEMRFVIVRYDHLTSFEILAHTFPMFLPSQLSVWSSSKIACFWKFATANFFQHFQKNWGHNYVVWWLVNLENCWRLLICTHWKFYNRPRYFFEPHSDFLFSPQKIFFRHGEFSKTLRTSCG